MFIYNSFAFTSFGGQVIVFQVVYVLLLID